MSTTLRALPTSGIMDVVSECDVLRDVNLVTDAGLKLGELALELGAVPVGGEQGAQGARPEAVVNRPVPEFEDEIGVEIVALLGGMLSMLGVCSGSQRVKVRVTVTVKVRVAVRATRG